MQAQGKSLNDVYKSFCAGKPELESKQFLKLCKDCKLIDKKFGLNDVDIVFAKVKSGKLKTITFAEFQNALGEIAKKKELLPKILKVKLNPTVDPHIRALKLTM